MSKVIKLRPSKTADAALDARQDAIYALANLARGLLLAADLGVALPEKTAAVVADETFDAVGKWEFAFVDAAYALVHADATWRDAEDAATAAKRKAS
jgi:hypothetical protein